jgi:glycogen debranching enzyme
MPDRDFSVLDGSTFVVGDRCGDIRADEGREHGFFSEDTRFVSHWVLRVGKAPIELLSLHQSRHFDAQFVLTPVVGPEEQAKCSIVRRRLIDHVWVEEVTVINHRHEASEIRLELEVGADFADLFEIKDGAIAAREVTFAEGAGKLTLDYRRDDFRRSLTVASTEPGLVTRSGFLFVLHLNAGEQWSTTFTVVPGGTQGVTDEPILDRPVELRKRTAAKAAELDGWLTDAPMLESDDRDLIRTYRAGLSDLGALRMRPDQGLAATLPAAGLPWFMALFGRDSLITSLQTLPYEPGLAKTTLRVLAADQATARDDFHEMEPGKILHELRFGELTARGERPHSPYFGSADATPLFLVLLAEYHRWTGDEDLVRELEPKARAALDWIAESGDPDGDGYVEYERRNLASGLANQCWKDSWDAIQFADGSLARGPIATAEIQGYVYDAQVRSAHLAREIWHDEVLAAKLEGRAGALRTNFRRDFWLPERGCHALALDGDKRPVDSLTSNIGHLLWSGILEESEAATVADRLLGDELFSGWGVRTLGRREAGYNPLGYHTGAVWPHDNSLIAAGLARYGHHEAAVTIAAAVLGAAPFFEHRLPEVFAGFPRSMTSVPVAFPTASRPQAWAAGTPLLLLSALLQLRPQSVDAEFAPAGGIGRIALRRSPTHQPSPTPQFR